MNNATPAVEPFPLPQYDAMENETKPKPARRRRAKGKIYYKEDFAGLWVFIQVNGEEFLLSHHVLAGDKRKIKELIDDF